MKGIKYDDEKPRMHLLPPKAITEVAKVLTFGAQKYSEDNWRLLDNLQDRYSSGALRHIFAHLDGEKLDPESGISHLAHALCCLLFKLEIELEEDQEKGLREPDCEKHSESNRTTQSFRRWATDNEKTSLRDLKHRVQHDSTE